MGTLHEVDLYKLIELRKAREKTLKTDNTLVVFGHRVV